MRNLLKNAVVVIFLGFAFHDQNMDLLSSGMPTNIKRVFATSHGISSNDRKVVVEQIIRALGRQLSATSVELGNNLTCAELFREYWRSLK
jgi:hypothetical protein